MADEMELREDDRLPWLETVEPDEKEGVPVGRVLAFVIGGLAILAAIIFAVYKLNNDKGPDG
ncbi:MAG: SPOR domain-containing protein, partial [Pseudomonadota bacterium]|nr:SPOR domain-containing protein [Pseudomonadota bacterium]